MMEYESVSLEVCTCVYLRSVIIVITFHDQMILRSKLNIKTGHKSKHFVYHRIFKDKNAFICLPPSYLFNVCVLHVAFDQGTILQQSSFFVVFTY